LDENSILKYLSEDEVREFMKEHTLFYGHGKVEKGKFCKLYYGKSASILIKKMLDICKFWYSDGMSIEYEKEGLILSQKVLAGFKPLEGNDDKDLYRIMGKCVAIFHKNLDTFFPAKHSYPTKYDCSFWRDVISILKLMGKHHIVSKTKLSELIMTIYIAVEDIIGENDGGIHGDIHMENVLTDGTGIKLIDFDMMGYGNRIFDFSVPYLSMLGKEHLFESFVEGYFSERTFFVKWKKFKEACLLSRIMCIISNIDECGNYKWLPFYVENTIEYVKIKLDKMPLGLEIFGWEE